VVLQPSINSQITSYISHPNNCFTYSFIINRR